MLSVVGRWQVCIDEGQDIQCNSWWHQISERDAAHAYSEVFCCQGGLSFFSCTYQSYTLIFLCKDINLKILVIQVRHTCILPEHNQFVHKDNRALSEIKMIKWSLIYLLREFCFSYREVSMVRFVLWGISVFKFISITFHH